MSKKLMAVLALVSASVVAVPAMALEVGHIAGTTAVAVLTNGFICFLNPNAGLACPHAARGYVPRAYAGRPVQFAAPATLPRIDLGPEVACPVNFAPGSRCFERIAATPAQSRAYEHSTQTVQTGWSDPRIVQACKNPNKEPDPAATAQCYGRCEVKCVPKKR